MDDTWDTQMFHFKCNESECLCGNAHEKRRLIIFIIEITNLDSGNFTLNGRTKKIPQLQPDEFYEFGAEDEQ